MNFDFDKYDDQFQVGISFAIHPPHAQFERRHIHIWFDLGRYYIEITF